MTTLSLVIYYRPMRMSTCPVATDTAVTVTTPASVALSTMQTGRDSTEPAFNDNFTTDGGFILCSPLVKRNVLVSVELIIVSGEGG